MKITDITIQIIKRDVGSLHGHDIAHGGTSFLSSIAEPPVFRVFTDEGIEGISCGRGGGVAAKALQAIKPALLGENPLYIEKIWQKIWEMDRIYQWPPSVLGTVDVALWDIIGKAANLPLYQLFGAYRDKIKTYASAMQHPDIEDYVREALECKERGYTAYKIHAHGGPSEHIAICRAVREAVADDMALMLDSLGVYNRYQALAVGRELERLHFHWFEEPIPDTDMDGLIQLCNALDIPVVTLEILAGNLYSRAPYVARGAGDMIRSGTIWNGGITPLKKTMALAEAFGLNCEIHVSGNPWMNAANLHVACAYRNCEYYEQLIPEEFWAFGVKEDFKRDSDGYIYAPNEPGLGVKTDWDYIDKHTVTTL